jgi:hypothetical protein
MMFARRMDFLTEKMQRLIHDGRYREAESLGKGLLSLDPDAPEPRRLLNFSRGEALRKAEKEVKALRKLQARRLETRMEEDYVLNSRIISFPDDFAEKSQRRQREMEKGREEEIQEVWKTRLNRILSTQVNFNFENISFSDVVKYLENTYQFTIVVSPEVYRDIFDEGSLPVDLKASGMSLEMALTWLAEPLGLRLALKNAALYIDFPEKIRGRNTMKYYDLRDLTYVLKDFIAPEISLGGNEEGGFTVNQEQTPEDEGLDLEGLKEIIEDLVKRFEDAY